MTDPLRNYDLKLTLSVIFPEPGDYEFVLLANGGVARLVWHALSHGGEGRGDSPRRYFCSRNPASHCNSRSTCSSIRSSTRR
jgi:hypothetical protein